VVHDVLLKVSSTAHLAFQRPEVLMGMATGVTIGAADLSLGNFVVIAVFTVIAASTVAVPGHRLPHRSTEEDAAGKAQASRPGSSLPREAHHGRRLPRKGGAGSVFCAWLPFSPWSDDATAFLADLWSGLWSG
jgi:hypothetical protein